MKLLPFCLLLVLYWPAALFVLLLYPLVWIVLLPLRLLGVAVKSVFQLLRAVLLLPVRLLQAA